MRDTNYDAEILRLANEQQEKKHSPNCDLETFDDPYGGCGEYDFHHAPTCTCCVEPDYDLYDNEEPCG